MSRLDRILGPRLDLEPDPAPSFSRADLRAVERYEGLLGSRPRTLETAYVEAFERLTPTQMQLHFDRVTRRLAVAPARGRTESGPVAWTCSGCLSWLATFAPAAAGWIVWSGGYLGEPGFTAPSR
ncbi:hypothetical protein [Leifsonia sp. C5G2]|uniref:hypothetical protein n=1 Tax=Leifsonia sp. C5G2 TaxID=2735269 RepID=UPI001584A58C|nr:hypothetical protein [Leifsonia sp. C5G2]NUU05250.1 hypothetical protein [Leifsonia sp. C5G2]